MDEDEIMEGQAPETETPPEGSVLEEGALPPEPEETDPAGGKADGTEPTPRAEEKPAQSHGDNAVARAARIRAVQETTDKLQKQFDSEVAGLGVPNPYTGKPFKNFREFKEYGEQFRREKLEQEAKRQGKSVAELQEEQENQSYLTRKRREEREQKQARDALEEQKAFMETDLKTFLTKYPTVDPGKLEQNAKFRKFAGKRLYKEPLSELYADFTDFVGDTERAAVARATSKTARSTGGGQGGGSDLLTHTQRKSLEEWNRENPTLKMTAKEFLEM